MRPSNVGDLPARHHRGARTTARTRRHSKRPRDRVSHQLVGEEHRADGAGTAVCTHRRTDLVAHDMGGFGSRVVVAPRARRRSLRPGPDRRRRAWPASREPLEVRHHLVDGALDVVGVADHLHRPLVEGEHRQAFGGTRAVASRPPRSARSRAPTTKTFPIVPATSRAAAAASSSDPPASSVVPAAHTQHATGNEAVPVSTISTGTGDERAASCAAPTVAEVFDPMWTDRTALAPDVGRRGEHLEEATRRRCRRRHGRAGREPVVEHVDVEVDALGVVFAVEHDRERDDPDAEAVAQLVGQLRVRVGDERDHAGGGRGIGTRRTCRGSSPHSRLRRSRVRRSHRGPTGSGDRRATTRSRSPPRAGT